MAAHMWHLSQELVGLAFFDGNLPYSMKRQMFWSLKRIGDEEPSKQVSINQQMMPSFNLNNLMTSTSKVLFQKLKLSSGFLQEDPDAWNNDNYFLQASSNVPELKVANDHIEIGVDLIQKYCGLKNKQQQQFLLKIVQERRKKFLTAGKNFIAIIAQNWNLELC